MSTFTIPLKRVIELTGGTITLEDNVSKMTGGNIGLNGYEIFDPAYKPHLDGRIIDHFYNREIGMETIDMFQLAMRRKMNEVMPYYNKLYLTERIAYDPLSTIDLRTVASGSTTQSAEANVGSTATSTSESASRAVGSDTPQMALSGSGDYATTINDANGQGSTNSEGSEESTNNATGESDSDSHVTGYQGLASDLVMRYRDSLLNIDLMVIRELEECFMLVWDNGDSYTKGYSL